MEIKISLYIDRIMQKNDQTREPVPAMHTQYFLYNIHTFHTYGLGKDPCNNP